MLRVIKEFPEYNNVYVACNVLPHWFPDAPVQIMFINNFRAYPFMICVDLFRASVTGGSPKLAEVLDQMKSVPTSLR